MQTPQQIVYDACRDRETYLGRPSALAFLMHGAYEYLKAESKETLSKYFYMQQVVNSQKP